MIMIIIIESENIKENTLSNKGLGNLWTVSEAFYTRLFI